MNQFEQKKHLLSQFGKFLCLSTMLASIASAQFDVEQSFFGNFPSVENQEYVLIGSAAWEEPGYVTVTPATTGQNGGFFTNTIGSGSYEQLQISFDIRLSEGGAGGADGYGFALLPTDIYGSDAVSGNNPGFSEEVNLTGALGIGFDTFDNGDNDRIQFDENVPEDPTGDRANESSISLHWDGTLLGNVWGPVQVPPINLEPPEGEAANYNINLFIEANDETGSDLTLTITNIDTADFLVPFAGLNIPDMNIQDYRIGFRGRTGNAWNKQEVGNVSISEDLGAPIELALLEPGAPGPLPELIGGSPLFGLDEGGVEGATRYTTGRQAGGAGPRLAVDAGMSGEADGHVSLTQSLGGEQNFITFASSDNGTRLGFGGRTGGSADTYQIDNVVQTSTSSRIVTDFDFRAITGSLADGFSVILVNSADYPDEDIPVIGTGTVETWGVAEDPLIGNGLGIGFKTFQSEQIRLRYNGESFGDEDNAPVQILNNEWQHAQVIAEACLDANENQGLCVTVSMEGFDVAGQPASGVVFDNVFISGATLGGLVPGGPGVPGDATGDGRVDAMDLNVVGGNWQMMVAGGISDGDFNEDGIVSAPDLNILGGNWQFGVAAAAVPEPGSGLLFAFGVFALLLQRRRR